MSLIDHDYFINEYIVPGLSGSNPVATANASRLTAIIAKREPEYLKVLLGEDLYTAFIAGLAAGSPAQKWVDLKAQLVDTAAHTSTYTGIIYYYWWRSKERQNTQTGSSETIHPMVDSVQLAALYNESVDLGVDVQTWISDHLSDYDDYAGGTLDKLNALW